MTPQFTYDNKGNPVGVFLPIEDWNKIKENLQGHEELPLWQKEILDKRMLQIEQNTESVIPLEDFIAEMEKEADAEV